MLEAMQGKTVTVGNHTYELPKPYMVLATQNPIENEGTYPLPEAQLDRFLFKLLIEFPSLEELKQIMHLTVEGQQEQIQPVLTAGDLMEMRQVVVIYRCRQQWRNMRWHWWSEHIRTVSMR